MLNSISESHLIRTCKTCFPRQLVGQARLGIRWHVRHLRIANDALRPAQ